MSPKRTILAALACLALAVAGCGGGGSDDNGSSSKKATSSSGSGGTAAPAAGGGVVKIAAKNIKFAPQDISVKVGQTIEWTNEDPIAHTVTSE
jgi:plastocyanin